MVEGFRTLNLWLSRLGVAGPRGRKLGCKFYEIKAQGSKF